MKVLGILGSPRSGGNSDVLLEHALAGARDAGAEVEKDLRMLGLREMQRKRYLRDQGRHAGDPPKDLGGRYRHPQRACLLLGNDRSDEGLFRPLVRFF